VTAVTTGAAPTAYGPVSFQGLRVPFP
jgi:hypothetical protein